VRDSVCVCVCVWFVCVCAFQEGTLFKRERRSSAVPDLGRSLRLGVLGRSLRLSVPSIGMFPPLAT